MLNTWACFKIDPKGPSMLNPGLAKALQITACKMYMTDRERSRAFAEKGHSGFVTTEWQHLYIAARAHGFVFNAHVVEMHTPYSVNFLLAEQELERVEELMQKASAFEGEWRSQSTWLSDELYDALHDFKNMTLN